MVPPEAARPFGSGKFCIRFHLWSISGGEQLLSVSLCFSNGFDLRLLNSVTDREIGELRFGDKY